jgi:Tol biopolymer transport system component
LLVACSIEIGGETATQAPAPTIGATASPGSAGSASGQMLYMTFVESDQAIVSYDVAAGTERIVFRASTRGYLTTFAVSPDGQQIIISYAAPGEEGTSQVGYNSLYRLPVAGEAEPELVIGSDSGNEAFFTPSWSPDGRYLYYAHYIRLEPTADVPFRYDVERIAWPDGEPEKVVENAIWPSLSPDGQRLGFLSFEPVTFTNYLYLAAADGGDPALVPGQEGFEAVDAHFFSPDSQSVVFSAVPKSEEPAGLSLLDRLLGVRPAAAHDVPSDWWRISLGGGAPEQLTHILDVGLLGDYSPDGQLIGFVGGTGLYTMKPDGTNLTHLRDVTAFGAFHWIP